MGQRVLFGKQFLAVMVRLGIEADLVRRVTVVHVFVLQTRFTIFFFGGHCIALIMKQWIRLLEIAGSIFVKRRVATLVAICRFRVNRVATLLVVHGVCCSRRTDLICHTASSGSTVVSRWRWWIRFTREVIAGIRRVCVQVLQRR